MATFASYSALGTNDRSKVSAALQSIVAGAGTRDRVLLIQVLLDDVADGRGRIGQKETTQALLAAKVLARVPEGAQVFGQTKNLRAFLKVVKSVSLPTDAQSEAMRCVANALLLVPSARQEWINIGGADACIDILERDHYSPEMYFPAARIVYLITVARTPYIVKMVDHYRIMDTLSRRLESIFETFPITSPWTREAMTDLLKITFNMTLQYPRIVDETPGGSNRVLGELWDDKFTVIVPTLLRLYHGLPPTSVPLTAPLTHVIHVLLNVPVESFSSLLFPPRSSPSSPNGHAHHPPESFGQRALNYLQRRSISSDRHPFITGRRSPPQQSTDTFKRSMELLNTALAHYFPSSDLQITEPDDPKVRLMAKKEDVNVDEALSPLALFIQRLVAGNDTIKMRARMGLLPPDLDRSTPLERRPDLLGRLVRLLTSVHMSRLKDAVGELLYAMCDSNAEHLAAAIGYGNVAGFLFNKGIMIPPPDSVDSDVNPITGTSTSTAPIIDFNTPMTEEEKEIEAERLFVLFDRLERSGYGVNPVRAAQQEGRFQEIE
ncbi:hypothetical protein DACRYDRAFT_85841 [Dacryopinax primogenitus]|uniref:Synembryn-A n=1 Tax=Dacryopinax primogenitus (strain DJM 731) TaxID=1858805 RepID=M5GBZ2_DACPD|nr:uncharacterized protein DACRYDRAFT_85841 [Dacryopinax primogenitus]EJU05980.1 hypothetical protein DACRYDRAFT_85841 [Dacryopinax primogenitus]